MSLVISVNKRLKHGFSKQPADEITLVEQRGVLGDAHFGETSQHMWDRRQGRTGPNQRQVHLISIEDLRRLATAGHQISLGEMGENITTEGVALLSLPTGARLRIGHTAVIEITGFRNPCVKIDRFQPGLLATFRQAGRGAKRAPGVMGVVVSGGAVRAGDCISVELPEGPLQPLVAV